MAFSENDACPTFMIASTDPRFDIGYNSARICSSHGKTHESTFVMASGADRTDVCCDKMSLTPLEELPSSSCEVR